MISVFLLESPIPPLFLLFALLSMTMLNASILRLGRIKSKEVLKHSYFFFRSLLRRFFPRHEWDTLHAAIGLSKNIYQLLYALSGFFFLATRAPYFRELLNEAATKHDWPPLFLAAALLLAISLICDFTARFLASLWPRQSLVFSSLISSFYLFIVFPIVYLLLHLTRGAARKAQAEEEMAIGPSRAQIKELIRESELEHHLDPFDQKLIHSFINFRERVAKEIMVPRVDVFSLDADTTIREAAQQLAKEGYSRIPIYRDTFDQIIGVILYKDLLKFYADPPKDGGLSLDSPLESIAKPVLYAPENKKITHLLQEVRNKQIHMAIIVDEYGGTEGIVTIEDILEELVGEIEDEYDIDEDRQFWPLPSGGWIVDAKMSILDIEEQLGIRIPSDPEYETVGGYVFHRAGTIPSKGWRLMHDEFDLEILSSDERSVKKIKIIPHPRSPEREA